MSLCSLSYLGGVLDRASAILCGSDAVTCPVTGRIINDMTFLMMCAMFNTAPLLGGTVVSLDRKKCPPALLRDLGSLK